MTVRSEHPCNASFGVGVPPKIIAQPAHLSTKHKAHSTPHPIVMSRIQPLRPLLRAFAAPRPFLSRPSVRYNSAIPAAAPTSQRAADLAAVEAVTESDSAQPGAPDPLRPSHVAPSKSKTLKTNASQKVADKAKANTVPFTPATQPQIPLTPPLYHVGRSKTKNLPVYTDYKRGGNLHQTYVRKLTGDLQALRDELQSWLQKKDADITINTLTGMVVVKGHCKPQIEEFLKARGF